MPHVKQMTVDVAVPSIVKVTDDVLVPVNKETLKKILSMCPWRAPSRCHESSWPGSCRRTAPGRPQTELVCHSSLLRTFYAVGRLPTSTTLDGRQAPPLRPRALAPVCRSTCMGFILQARRRFAAALRLQFFFGAHPIKCFPDAMIALRRVSARNKTGSSKITVSSNSSVFHARLPSLECSKKAVRVLSLTTPPRAQAGMSARPRCHCCIDVPTSRSRPLQGCIREAEVQSSSGQLVLQLRRALPWQELNSAGRRKMSAPLSKNNRPQIGPLHPTDRLRVHDTR